LIINEDGNIYKNEDDSDKDKIDQNLFSDLNFGDMVI